MSRDTIFSLTVGACLIAGLTSPLLFIIFALPPVWLPEMLRPTQEIVFYGASLIVATLTLLLSALPAAVAERMGAGLDAALKIWLAGAIFLAGMGFLGRGF